MDEPNLIQADHKASLPRPQIALLLAALIGYPIVSILMNLLGKSDPAQITSKITQIYLPSLAIQLIILFAIIYTIYFTGSRLSDIGLARQDFNWSNTLSGLIFFAGAWGFILIIRGAIVGSGYIPEKDFLYLLPSTKPEKAVWLLLSIGAALSEELTFRGFVITRLKTLSNSYWLAAILSSAAFSLGHLYQGLTGVILTFVYGLLFTGLFIARGSVFPCIVAHFLQDALILLAF